MAGVWTPHRDVMCNSFRPMPFYVDTAVTANTPVQLVETSNGIKPCADNGYCLGIAAESGSAAATVMVWTSGEFLGTAGSGGTIGIHAWCALNAATTVIEASTTAEYVVGWATAAATSGSNIYMLLISQLDNIIAPNYA